jgi:hypothetical protein
MAWWKWTIGIVVIMGCCGQLLTNGGSESSPGVPNVTDEEAADFCEKMVTKNLKAPSTAVFPSRRETTVTSRGHNMFTVIGYVDAENSFGAKLRTPYRCDPRMSDGKWYLDEFIME